MTPIAKLPPDAKSTSETSDFVTYDAYSGQIRGLIFFLVGENRNLLKTNK